MGLGLVYDLWRLVADEAIQVLAATTLIMPWKFYLECYRAFRTDQVKITLDISILNPSVSVGLVTMSDSEILYPSCTHLMKHFRMGARIPPDTAMKQKSLFEFHPLQFFFVLVIYR